MTKIDTLSHGFWTYYLFRHQPNKISATIGGVLPDFAMYVVAGNMMLQGKFEITKHWLPQIFSQPGMWNFDSMMHSIPLWLLLAVVGITFKIDWLKWLVIGGFFHIAIDVFTHQQYISAYLWPFNFGTISGFVDYHSPIFTAIDCSGIFLALVYSLAKWGFQKVKMEKTRV